MAELATSQIIKMALAVLVIGIVVGGASYAVYSYIIPYFKGLGPIGTPDFTTPFYTDLIQNGVVTAKLFDNYIYVKNVKTPYYFEDDGELREDINWAWDTYVGKVSEKTAQIEIEKEFLNIPELAEVNEGFRIGNEIRKPAPAK